MQDHDQRFKVLLREFIVEFFLLFFPEWAKRFDFARIEWLEQEVFPDPPQGERFAVDLVAKDPAGISYDSLRKAVMGGADHLYSELTGGDHRSGWMIAWHHPLLAGWMFSKRKGDPAVSLAPKLPWARRERNPATLVFGALPGAAGLRVFSVQGRRLESRILPASGPGGQ